jgi:RNA polymerase sigma factor (sigma-70 family)
VAERTDEVLFEAWRGGDAEAGSELFERYFEPLYRFLRNKLETGVEDLLQQTFLACVRRKHALREGGKFRAYLFTVARHELFEHWRQRRKRAGEVDVAEISLADLGTSPTGVIARQAEHRLLLRALCAIPLDLQIAIELHYWEGMTGPELAEVLGIPEGTVRSRLRRAQEALEAAMVELAEDAESLASTRNGLDKWAESLALVVYAGKRKAS